MTLKTWKIFFTETAEKQFSKLDKPTKIQISNYIEKRLMMSENPRALGKALNGNFATFWRYRVGDYRLICDIDDDRISVNIIKIGHRKDIYE